MSAVVSQKDVPHAFQIPPALYERFGGVFDACRDAFAYDKAALAELVALWRQLLSTHAANAMCIEDIAAPPDRRLLWFCFKVFVDDAYVRYLKTEAPPLLGRHILDLHLQNQSPLMDLVRLRRENSPGGQGVNILVLNSGAPPYVVEAGLWAQVIAKVVEFTPLCSGGYRLNELLLEVYDDFGTTWAEGMGMHLRATYPDFRHPEQKQPRLYGIAREEGQSAVGSLFSPVFQHQWPCYGFSHAEQELLQWALWGESDNELAQSLSLSPASIRKRWETIYRKVETQTPQFFAENDSAGRGGEKKRILLGYLRHHLEELRPVSHEK